MTAILPHVWEPAGRNARFLQLKHSRDSVVDTQPMPGKGYLWQFRQVASYAATVDQAKEYVEAGAEFFDVMRRNPYT